MAARSTAIVHWLPDWRVMRTACGKSGCSRRIAHDCPDTMGWNYLRLPDVTCPACLLAVNGVTFTKVEGRAKWYWRIEAKDVGGQDWFNSKREATEAALAWIKEAP